MTYEEYKDVYELIDDSLTQIMIDIVAFGKVQHQLECVLNTTNSGTIASLIEPALELVEPRINDLRKTRRNLDWYFSTHLQVKP